MKAAYTGWTWIASREPEEAKKQLEQSFKECKFLGYDTVQVHQFYPAALCHVHQLLGILREKVAEKGEVLHGVVS